MRRAQAITSMAISTLAGVTGSVILAAPSHATGSVASNLPGVVFTGWSLKGVSPNTKTTIAGRDGAHPATLTVRTADGTSPCVGGCSEFTFSPDGTRVAFLAGSGVTTSPDPTGQLWIANADGSDAHLLVNSVPVDTSYGYAGRMAWSPDSATIYFAAVFSEVSAMWQVNADGSGLKKFPAATTSSLVRQPNVLADGRVVFSDSMTVKVYDPAHGTTGVFYSQPVDDGFTVSPDGTKIAVATGQTAGVGGVLLNELTINNVDGTGDPVPVSAPGEAAMDPVWSPDGGAIAFVDLDFARGNPIESHLMVHELSDPVGTDTDLTALMGQDGGQGVSWVPQGPPVHRIGGGDRYATGRMVSQDQWQNGQAGAVVLARGDQSPDALAGVPLAAHVHGPLLLTDPKTLDPATRAEIDRVLGGPSTKKTIYILGGEGAVSPAIAGQLSAAGYTVVRYGGQTRYETALQIASAFGPTSHVIVTYGLNFPDALSAGPLGAAENAPIVLSGDGTLDAETAAFIGQHTAIDPVGGQAQRAVATLNTAGKTVDETLGGADRYATNMAVATRIVQLTGHTPTTAGIASGMTFPDALTGGALEANNGTPLLLTDPNVLSGTAISLLSAWQTQLTSVLVFGGESAVSGSAFNAVLRTVHGKAA